MAKVKYVPIPLDMAEDIEELSDEEIGLVVRAYLQYGRSGETAEMPRTIKYLYNALVRELDRASDGYEKKLRLANPADVVARRKNRPKKSSSPNRHSSTPNQSRSPNRTPLHHSSATKKPQKSSKAQTRCWTKRNGRDSPTRRRQWRRSTSLWRTTERKKFWNASKSPGKQENRIFDT